MTMKEKSKLFYRNILSKYMVFFVFFFIILLILLPGTLWTGTDDTTYIEQLTHMGILEWVWMRATTWQPRIISDFLLALFHFNLPVWKMATATATTLLLLGITKYPEMDDTLHTPRIYSHIVPCSAFFVMCPYVISSSIVWYTGSFFYLWPTLFLVIALMPFYDAAVGSRSIRYGGLLLSILCSLLTGYQEQCAAIMICFALFTFAFMLYHKERIPKYLILQFILVCINVGVYLTLGGTEIRLDAELYWYKDYHMLSLTDRLFQGVNWANYHLFNASNVLMFLLSGLIFLSIFYRYKSIWIKIFAAIPFAAFFVSILPIQSLLSRASKFNSYLEGQYNFSSSLQIAVEWLLDPTISKPSNFSLGLAGLLPAFFCFLILIDIGWLLTIAFQSRRHGFVNMVVYFAALASVYSLSFSPTIFASRTRIFFAANTLIILLIALLFKELDGCTGILTKKWFRPAIAVLVITAMLFAFEQFSFNLHPGAQRF